MLTAVDQKLKECKELCIQNLEKPNFITKQMVFKFFQDNHWDQRVKSIKVNPKLGVAGLEFIDHESAKLFYETFNFEGKIINRPFNIYFHLTLNENEMKKYYIEGITEQTQRAAFQAAYKIGVCKLYTNYEPTLKSKLKPTGIISFNRKEDLKEQQQKQLQKNLQKLGIELSKYTLEDIKNQKQQKIDQQLNGKYKSKLNQNENNSERNPLPSFPMGMKMGMFPHMGVTNLKAKLDQLKKQEEILIKDPKNNPYISLFTSGLYKPQDISSDKAFENVLLESFRQVNKNVVQVSVFQVKGNNNYDARVYFKSAQDGKDFIVDYTNKRDCFAKFYKDKNYISFNINVPSPSFPMQMKMGIVPPSMQMNPMQIGRIPPPMQMGSMGLPPSKMEIINLKANIDKLKKDKEILMKDPNVKKYILPTLKTLLINNYLVNTFDAAKQANQILNENSTEDIFSILQKPESLQKILGVSMIPFSTAMENTASTN